MDSKKPRLEKKEALGKKILKSCREPRHLRYLDIAIAGIYDSNKKEVEKRLDRMKKLDELYKEFTTNKMSFIEKYAGNNSTILKMLRDYPDLFDNPTIKSFCD